MNDNLFDIAGNELRFRNGNVVRFEHPIGDVLQFGDVLVVQVWPPRGATYNENIFGVDLSGNILWQIEPQYPNTVTNASFGVHEEEGYAVVGNIKDLVLYLDPATGKIVKRFWQTQQGFKPIPPGESVIQ
jgi:hypothetical protein